MLPLKVSVDLASFRFVCQQWLMLVLGTSLIGRKCFQTALTMKEMYGNNAR